MATRRTVDTNADVYAIFERTGLRKRKAEKLKARQMDDLCDRFNVTAV